MSAAGSITADELELLKSFDTPTVCNAIELFDVRSDATGYMDARIQCCFPKLPPVVGYAATATYRSAAPVRSANASNVFVEQLRSFADVPSPAIVVIQDLDDPPRAATFGDVMCTTYKAFGVVGLIASGAGRDLDQIEALAFPVFASGTISAHGYFQLMDVNVPVSVAGVTIYPGDLIHADRNGATTIPLEIASDVGRACQDIVDTESLVLDYVRNAVEPSVDEFAAIQDRMRQRIVEVRKQRTKKA